MGNMKHDARLVGLLQRTEIISLVGIRHYEKTCEVVLVVLNLVLQHFQSVEFGG